jgi:hypothetical protein
MENLIIINSQVFIIDAKRPALISTSPCSRPAPQCTDAAAAQRDIPRAAAKPDAAFRATAQNRSNQCHQPGQSFIQSGFRQLARRRSAVDNRSFAAGET